MNDERNPIDPDGHVDGIPAFKMREGESANSFAGRLVDALDRTPPKRLTDMELRDHIVKVYPEAMVTSSLYEALITLINFVGKMRFQRKLNLELIASGREFSIDDDGNVIGMVSVENGYDYTGIQLDKKTMDAITINSEEAGILLSGMHRELKFTFPQLHDKIQLLSIPRK